MLAILLDNSGPDITVKEAEQYTKFDLESRRPSLYKNYRRRGQELVGLYFYKYTSQIFIQIFTAATGRTIYFLFKNIYPQHATHVQVSVNLRESLTTPSLYGSFTRFQNTKNSILSSISRTQDEINKTLLSLFYP